MWCSEWGVWEGNCRLWCPWDGTIVRSSLICQRKVQELAVECLLDIWVYEWIDRRCFQGLRARDLHCCISKPIVASIRGLMPNILPVRCVRESPCSFRWDLNVLFPIFWYPSYVFVQLQSLPFVVYVREQVWQWHADTL
jgi:hypothetical protein